MDADVLDPRELLCPALPGVPLGPQRLDLGEWRPGQATRVQALAVGPRWAGASMAGASTVRSRALVSGAVPAAALIGAVLVGVRLVSHHVAPFHTCATTPHARAGRDAPPTSRSRPGRPSAARRAP